MFTRRPARLLAIPVLFLALSSAALAGEFDGTWEISAEGGSGCPIKSSTGTIEISGSVLSGLNPAGRPFKGTVSDSGKVLWRNLAASGGGQMMTHTGQLTGASGEGTYQSLGGNCRGTFTMMRQN